MLDKNDIQNCIGLINRAQLQGNEALGVALLLQKLQNWLVELEAKEEEVDEPKKK